MGLAQRARTFLSHALQPCFALLYFLRELWLICTHLPFFFCETPDEIAARTRKLAEAHDDWTYVTVDTEFGQIEERYMNRGATIPPG